MLSRFHLFLAAVLLITGCSPSSDTPEEAKKAFQLAAEGKVKKAAALLLAAQKKDPGNGLFPFYLGRLYARHFNELLRGNVKFMELKKLPHPPFGQYLEMKNPDGSIAGYQFKDLTPVLRHYLKAIQVSPKLADAYIESAMIYASIFQLTRAHALLERAAVHMPDNHRFPFLRAYLFRHVGEYKKALAMYKKAHHIEPESSKVHFYRGTLLLKLDRPSEAATLLSRVVHMDKNPKDVRQAIQGIFLHHYLKGLKGDKHAFQAAVNWGEKYVARIKKQPGMMIRLGKAAYLSGSNKKAYAWLKIGLEEVQTDPQALTFFGELQETRGENNNALESYRRALAVQDRVHTRYLLGSLLLKLKKSKAAIKQLEAAATIRKNDPLILYKLALAVKASDAASSRQRQAWKRFLKYAIPAGFNSSKIAEARKAVSR